MSNKNTFSSWPLDSFEFSAQRTWALAIIIENQQFPEEEVNAVMPNQMGQKKIISNFSILDLHFQISGDWYSNNYFFIMFVQYWEQFNGYMSSKCPQGIWADTISLCVKTIIVPFQKCDSSSTGSWCGYCYFFSWLKQWKKHYKM